MVTQQQQQVQKRKRKRQQQHVVKLWDFMAFRLLCVFLWYEKRLCIVFPLVQNIWSRKRHERLDFVDSQSRSELDQIRSIAKDDNNRLIYETDSKHGNKNVNRNVKRNGNRNRSVSSLCYRSFQDVAHFLSFSPSQRTKLVFFHRFAPCLSRQKDNFNLNPYDIGTFFKCAKTLWNARAIGRRWRLTCLSSVLLIGVFFSCVCVCFGLKTICFRAYVRFFNGHNNNSNNNRNRTFSSRLTMIESLKSYCIFS